MAPPSTQLGLATAALALLPPAALSVEHGTRKAHGVGGDDDKISVSVNAHGDVLLEKGEQADTQGRERAEVGLQAGEVAADSDAKAMKHLQASLENELGLTPTEKQKDAFQKMDSNGDGVVSFEEFQASFVGDKEEFAPHVPVSRDEFTAYENGKKEEGKKPGAGALAQTEAATGAGKLPNYPNAVKCHFGLFQKIGNSRKFSHCVEANINLEWTQYNELDEIAIDVKWALDEYPDGILYEPSGKNVLRGITKKEDCLGRDDGVLDPVMVGLKKPADAQAWAMPGQLCAIMKKYIENNV